MGQRGPPRTPTKILEQRGSWLAKARKETEPEPTPGRPDPPEWLDDLARAEWDLIVPHLDGMGVLALIDRSALELYCDTYARWRKAVENLHRYGQVKLVVSKKRGRVPVVSPWVRIAKDLAAQLKQLLAQFGMTPSARASLHVPKKKPSGEDSPFAAGSKAG